MIFTLMFTIVCYCIIPTILRFTLIKKRQLSKGKLIAIVIVNGAVVFLVIHIADFILSKGNYSEISLIPVVIWSFANYWILYSGNLKYHKSVDTSQNNGNKIASNDATYTYVNTADDIEEKTDINTQEEVMDSQEKKQMPKSTKICIVLIVALVVAMGVGGYFIYDWGHYDGYQEGYSLGHDEGYESGSGDAESIELWETAQQAELYKDYLIRFLDNAVLVTEYGEKYHRLGCHYIQDSDKIWIYNPENAEVQGYDACSYCFGKDAQTYLTEDLQ